ncbi:amino acid permease [uncultured Enorma sp.]|uniref:amino acid permease n=1 Tax=uncultured Enorma sp. TaxID=1714346 RepID=UPI0028043B59|nr:amino acid permease [uncultured Enorma sp.]
MAESTSTEKKSGGGLGFWVLVITIFSSMIGSGVYDLSYQLGTVASPGAAIVAFAICYVGTLVSALSLKNLLERDPEGDGLFCYARRAFGKFAEFMSAWGYWISGWVGNVSFATMTMIAFGTFFPEVFGDTGTSWPSIIVASAVMWVIAWLVNRGVEQSVRLNTIVTIIKIIPLLLFIVIGATAFSFGVFTTDFWTNFAGNMEAAGTGFDLGSVAAQVNDSMLSLIWVFIGVESVALLSRHAVSKKVAGSATVVGLTLVTLIEFIVAILPYGIMPADEFIALGEPSLGQMYTIFMGPVGASFVQAALIISIFGSWLAYTLMPTESVTYLADEGSLPKIFGKKNKNGVATFSLFLTVILCEILLVSMHFTEDAYNFSFSLSSSAILIVWIFIDLQQVKYTLDHRDEPGAVKNLILGLIGLVYYLVAMFVSGISYVMLCGVLWVIGIPLYYMARKASGEEKVFVGKDWLLVGLSVVMAIGGVWMMLNGMV